MADLPGGATAEAATADGLPDPAAGRNEVTMQDERTRTVDSAGETAQHPQGEQAGPAPLRQEIEATLAKLEEYVGYLRGIPDSLRERQLPVREAVQRLEDFSLQTLATRRKLFGTSCGKRGREKMVEPAGHFSKPLLAL